MWSNGQVRFQDRNFAFHNFMKDCGTPADPLDFSALGCECPIVVALSFPSKLSIILPFSLHSLPLSLHFSALTLLLASRVTSSLTVLVANSLPCKSFEGTGFHQVELLALPDSLVHHEASLGPKEYIFRWRQTWGQRSLALWRFFPGTSLPRRSQGFSPRRGQALFLLFFFVRAAPDQGLAGQGLSVWFVSRTVIFSAKSRRKFEEQDEILSRKAILMSSEITGWRSAFRETLSLRRISRAASKRDKRVRKLGHDDLGIGLLFPLQNSTEKRHAQGLTAVKLFESAEGWPPEIYLMRRNALCKLQLVKSFLIQKSVWVEKLKVEKKLKETSKSTLE